MKENQKKEILAKHLNVPYEEIRGSTNEFLFRNRLFKVMDDVELIEEIKKELTNYMDSPFVDFSFKEIKSGIGVSAEQIKHSLVAEILVGNISVNGIGESSINGNVFYEFLRKENLLEEFLNKHAEMLVKEDSYWHIFQYNHKKRIDDFNVFHMYDLPTLSDEEVEQIMMEWE